MALSFSSTQHHFDSSSFTFPADDYHFGGGGADDFFWPQLPYCETEFVLPLTEFLPVDDSVSYCETEFLLPPQLHFTESYPHQDFVIPEEDSVFQFDGVIIPPAPEFIHEPTFLIPNALPLPVFQPPAGEFSIGKPDDEAAKKSELSAQSIAARKRRRRISEKTQELGKLIPGGNKMNTADMFQAAAKYVRFLQAQLAVLQLTTSLQEPIEMPKEMEKIVTSPEVQKKLYSEEKCLVPTELLHALAIDELLAEEAE
ncbi:Transcription factor bHLH52 [Linum grandiflorum]